MSKVYITAVGVNSPIGCTYGDCLQAIENGTKGLNHLQNIDTTNFPSTFAGEVKHNGQVVKTAAHVDRKEFFIQNAFKQLFAADDFRTKYKPENLFIQLGAGIDYFDLTNYISTKHNLSHHWQQHCTRAYDTARNLAVEYNLRGGFGVNVSACVASSQAIGLAFRMLKDNPERAIITGGFDSMLSHLHYMGFYKLGALSSYQGNAEDSCKPFDKNRCGLVIGEGGIALLLESEANVDPNKILGEIVGYGSTLDSYMVTDPEPNGTSLARAAMQAIEEAGITPNDIDCAHLHETGTLKNAIAESKAMQLIFGERSKDVPVYSMKGQVGHLIGACGAMEMIGVLYSLNNQKVPHTVNFESPDLEVPVRVIQHKPLEIPINYILKLNAAFGGQNTALVIKKVQGAGYRVQGL